MSVATSPVVKCTKFHNANAVIISSLLHGVSYLILLSCKRPGGSGSVLDLAGGAIWLTKLWYSLTILCVPCEVARSELPPL